MPVGEAFLSAFLQVLFDRLASRELLQLAFAEGVLSKLKKWEGKLRLIQAVLSDAEESQLDSKNAAVNIWLDDLQDLAYDVEDILDKFTTYALGRQLMAEHRPSSSRVQNFIPSVKFKLSMWSKMKTITSRLEELCKTKDELRLEGINGSSATPNPRPPSASIPIEPAVYGRDDDKVKIIKMVLATEPSEANFCVIPIVGMGGIGKTTLAREVYNDKAVEDNFNIKGWVCVSNDFDIIQLSQKILQSITRCPCHLTDLNLIQIEMRDHLRDRKFFLVLDDVWSNDYNWWESLRSPFKAGALGSRIIVTTRSFDVASTITGSTKHHALKPLPNEDCWSLFKKHAFESKDPGEFPHLEESVREKVIDKCKGLPLVAKTLGGLLRSKQRFDEWDDILNSEIWNLSYENDRILPVLRLSYYHLPPHLKKCFGYCAILPKNFEFDETQLVFLWMAEGFIQQSEDNKQPEEIGGKYFRDLLSRSIFQQSSSDESKFVMHDLVNDLAQWVSQKTCFRLNDELRPKNRQRRFNMARHSSYTCSSYDSESKFAVFYDVKRLRTFLPIRYDDSTHYVTSVVLYDLLPKFKKLRVLSLATYNITKLPNSIGSLVHLRYLNFSQTKIKYLPESTSSLYNLQILILADCCDLVKLPTKMRNLIKLRYLDITGANSIKEMPVGMKELKNLQNLSNFVVTKGTGSNLEDLKCLKFLREKLCIVKLDNSQVTKALILRDKDGLNVLMLEWSSQFDNSRNATVEKHVLEMLQPHENLEELTIKCYAGTTFPRWLGDPLWCSKMVVLRLESCKNCTSLPSLGLLRFLADLTIKGMMGIKRIGSEIDGEDCSESFRSLKNLCFEDLEEWENWDLAIENKHVKRFPCLQRISIKNCPKLSGAPLNHLQSLEKLVILKCQKLVVSLSSLQMLCELEIDGCKEMVCSSLTNSKSLRSATLSNSSEFGTWLRKGQSILTSLKVLRIKNCNVLTSLPDCMKNCYHLEYLEIQGCDSLTSIVRDRLPSSLKTFSVKNCKELQCLLDGKDDPSSSVINESFLEYLHIADCPTLTSLSLEAQSFAALKFLEIWNCAKLATLSSTGQLPVALKHLQIRECLELTTLSVSHQLPETLEYLQIDNCPELELIGGRIRNNMSLHFLEISSCKKLRSLPDGLQTLGGLQNIKINDCPSLVSFPQGGLPNSIASVSICRCEKLKALHSSMHNLNFLQNLEISQCPNIQLLPDEGFPTNLTSLSVEDQNICRSLVEWGLHKLTSLKHLSIFGWSDEVSFPREEMLPTSLTKLTIQKFPKLKYLSSQGFQNLTSLEHLLIRECPNLMSLPEETAKLLILCYSWRLLISVLVALQNKLMYYSVVCQFVGLEAMEENEYVERFPRLPELSIVNCPKLSGRLPECLPSLEKLDTQMCAVGRKRLS